MKKCIALLSMMGVVFVVQGSEPAESAMTSSQITQEEDGSIYCEFKAANNEELFSLKIPATPENTYHLISFCYGNVSSKIV